METILSFEDVSYSYLDGSSTVTILDKANYDFEKGKIYAIVGASGSGKTTTIVLAGGLDKPKEGKVNFKGTDINQIGLNKYRRNDISIVFQAYNLIYYMNAYENVANAIEIPNIKVPNKKEYCLNILQKLGLTKETEPEKIEEDLMRVLPEDHWILWNIHIITLGRTICTARKPDCGNCFLKQWCPACEEPAVFNKSGR